MFLNGFFTYNMLDYVLIRGIPNKRRKFLFVNFLKVNTFFISQYFLKAMLNKGDVAGLIPDLCDICVPSSFVLFM